MGLAVGDALGTTLEFCPPGTFNPIHEMVGGGPFRLKPGQWTDDTSMALCLAESLLECQGFDPVDQMERYVRWWREAFPNQSRGATAPLAPRAEKTAGVEPRPQELSAPQGRKGHEREVAKPRGEAASESLQLLSRRSVASAGPTRPERLRDEMLSDLGESPGIRVWIMPEREAPLSQVSPA